MFGKKRNNGTITTLVGEGTRIKGDLRFEGGCHVDGVINGNVISERAEDAFGDLLTGLVLAVVDAADHPIGFSKHVVRQIHAAGLENVHRGL